MDDGVAISSVPKGQLGRRSIVTQRVRRSAQLHDRQNESMHVMGGQPAMGCKVPGSGTGGRARPVVHCFSGRHLQAAWRNARGCELSFRCHVKAPTHAIHALSCPSECSLQQKQRQAQ